MRPLHPELPNPAHTPAAHRRLGCTDSQLKFSSRSPRRAHAVSLVRAEPQACVKRGTRRQDKAIGLWSWLWCPGLTALRRGVMRPRARRPSARLIHDGQATHVPDGPSTAQRQLRHARASRRGRLCRSRSRSGSRLRAWRLVSRRARWIVGSQVGASVSVAALSVRVWGVVQLGERRLRACRCSRGRRPSGSDSEATAPLAALPQRHPSGAGGRLTRTRLQRACRLQRPCSLPTCLCFRG